LLYPCLHSVSTLHLSCEMERERIRLLFVMPNLLQYSG
jgi:hypothetical protein